jgi:general secretion pathway protein G
MRQKGFTLVEMLLVLAIIGILMFILLPSVVGVTRDAKEKQAKADLRLIQAALGEYYIKNNDFPPTGAGYEVYLLALRPRIIEKDPVDPFHPTGLQYGYDYLPTSLPGEIPTYVVWSVGFSQREEAEVNASDEIMATADCIYVTNAAKPVVATP